MADSNTSWHKIAHHMMVISFLLLIGILVYAGFGKFDGVWFPVQSQFTITAVNPSYRGPGWMQVQGNFDKLRLCVFKGVEWYYAESGTKIGQVQVPAFLEDRPIIRELGTYSYDNLNIHIGDKETILYHSKGYVIHDCYGGLLPLTKTFFYDGTSYIHPADVSH